jgi:hypothetical protein
MTSIVFAAVVATVLFFCFERTRGFGVIGVFALIAIKPLLFSILFVTLGLLYLYITNEWRNKHALFK